MRRTTLAGAALALLALAPAAAAQTHREIEAHRDIEAHAVVLFDGGKVVALHMGWRFEPEQSGALARSYDFDRDGTLSAGETAALERETFQVFADADYLTPAFVDGAVVTWPRAEAFAPLALPDSLAYSFRLPLPQPVDPRRQAFRFSTYGDAYHVHIAFPGENAIRLVGDGAEGCRAILGPDLENRLYGGVVVPTKVEVICD